jgi:predicted dehydrogenase
MSKIKYGIIGVGALGRHHARWAQQIDSLQLSGVYDIVEDRAVKVADELGCKAFDSLDSLIDSSDAASIAVTTSNHCEVALKVIEAGRHLLIEKPIASTLEETDRIIKAAENKQVKLMVGHIERFNPALDALKKYNIRPRFIEAHRLAAFNPRGTDVAVVLDLMIHDIDLALHLVKSPVVQISASAVNVISDTEDIANARLTFENGAVANLTASRISLKPMRKMRIFQTSGYFSLDLAEKKADLYRMLDAEAGDGELAIPLGNSGQNIGYMKTGDTSTDMLCAELESFAAAILEDRPPPISGGDGRDALAVALSVIEESHKGARAFVSDER